MDDTAHLAVLDATGHDLGGTLMAAVALAAYRNARRGGLDLQGTATVMSRLVAEQGRWERFATGVIGRLDLATGRFRYLNAGHPSPLLMRRGKVVKELGGGRRILLGLDGEVEVAEEWLEPEDWIIFYTDGITEARSTDGSQFGLDRLVRQLETSAAEGQPPPETLRRVIHDVLAYQRDRLQDDATVLIAQWATGGERRMASIDSGVVDHRDLSPAAADGAVPPRR